MINQNINIEKLNGMGPKRAALFNKLNIHTIDDLIMFFPRHYEDWKNCYSVSNAPINENCCIKGYVCTKVSEARIRKGLTLYKFTITDGIMKIFVTLFNTKYTAKNIHYGKEYLFFGKVTYNGRRKEMNSPAVEPTESDKIRPIYHTTKGLTSKIIEKYTRTALDMIKDDLYDPIPAEIRQKYELCHKRYAIEKIHFPINTKEIEIAKKRLVFEELLILQLGLLRLRNHTKKETTASFPNDYTKSFIDSLPFTPTNAQLNAIKAAIDDCKKEIPMSRLLQGDVGSGKTAVAAALLYNAAKNGFQSAFMAPTEILAIQHYSSLSKMMKGSNITIMILTGSTPASEKRKIYELLKSGNIDIIVGTHAIIQDNVEFKKLGLVITDEQHRFGVNQRASLSEKGQNPHTLVMSATPIPRTLALVIYGDLDVSILDEMPKGRKAVETYYINSKLRVRAYNYIKKHLDKGLQGYIVCPMVEESESDLASAVKFYEELKEGFFKDYSVGLVNGKMKPTEKDAVMKNFSNGKIDILIATTVIEVGVDVPNANIIVIENAERFGLSQLHQLRGRVGRGNETATCILVSDAENPEAKKRLEILCKTTDGFEIADEDLKLRGPGDFFGSKQHGLPPLKIASIFDDKEVLKTTAKVARIILESDPELKKNENLLLKESVDNLFSGNMEF